MSGGKDGRGLSNASRSDDGHEPARKHFFANRADIFNPADHSGEWRRQWICGLSSGERSGQFPHRTPLYWREKTKTAAGHSRRGTRTIAVKRFTRGRKMDTTTDILAKKSRPNRPD